jgi:lysophospholipase L1-like esterase
VSALGIPTVDLLEALSGHPDPLSLFPFRLESHLTAEGYDLMARALDERIKALPFRSEGSQTPAMETE